jgi:TatD DNase family protein
LDYKFAKQEIDKQKQISAFERFIDLANKYDKPIIVHSRYAQSQVLELLEQKKAKKVLLHSFVDSSKLIQRAIENNFFISVGMSVIENIEIQDRIKLTPIENILLETDSPIHFYGKKAMPENITDIAKKVAELKGISMEEMSNKLKQNFSTLFGMI